MLKVYHVLHLTIWYHLYNFKNVKNTHGGMSLLAKLHAYITHGNII